MAPQEVLEVVGKLLEVGQLPQAVLEIHHLFLLRRGITAEMLHYLHLIMVVVAGVALLLQEGMELELLVVAVEQGHLLLSLEYLLLLLVAVAVAHTTMVVRAVQVALALVETVATLLLLLELMEQ
jgi:hypothetical protein